MNKEVAQSINSLMLDYFAKLNSSVKFVQENCTEDEFKEYRKAIGEIMGVMTTDVMMPIYKKYPDLEPEDFK